MCFCFLWRITLAIKNDESNAHTDNTHDKYMCGKSVIELKYPKNIVLAVISKNLWILYPYGFVGGGGGSFFLFVFCEYSFSLPF